ncbi:RNA polymerase subunit sigma [Corynebacterium sp. HMSC062E11]|uniref:sigma-70 family RNA polymerase sigma factor n=1 Tax=unclassified Corynebacterium TaxID=2624378 RepID=UPI0008A2117E|nr:MULTISPECIES: sigma-70 family RNA polymerase sigma factor [unclassified Corynebacterium]MDK6806274.1 sigma-70 family RNA polymerase sigma factor [Corynebacterium aurimucosum]NJJ82388.1 sigma-70 family RNA polymerase sigma factor [Corynebacterium aurimucosum]OFK28779.1 RNA polymerase subunit sigma [Corynebacterium sp. HMSC062E11]OFP72621.1 RNA polymerase subunit sigma [Corynebacterium sp. HMSC078C09]
MSTPLLEVSSTPVPAMSPNEHERLNRLLVQTASADKHAFSALYDALAPTVYSVCLSVLRNPALAEEVAQDVFVEVWTSAAKFDPQRGNARSWVGRLAHGRAVDKLRSHVAAVQRDDRDSKLEHATFAEPIEDEALNNVEAHLLRRAVVEIGEPHSTAVALAFFDGLTHAELAESTGVPLGTAKTRVRDGVKKLKAILGREGR